MPQLARITLYPIKSLDGVDVPTAEFLPTGPLANDRRYALFDRAGRLINGKRTPAVHRIRATYAPDFTSVQLSVEDSPLSATTFDLQADRTPFEKWLTDTLAIPCTIQENTDTAFPDDAQSPGPTVISSGTLNEIARWFDLSPEEVHRRFRPNLVIDADEPFWEDRLFSDFRQRPVLFSIGSVRLHGVNPCERCVVPTRHPTTGDVLAAFAKRFVELRQQSLPAWASPEAFDHFYRVTVNTRLAANQQMDLHVRIGDMVTLA